jgi:hypothetical protein
VSLKKKAARAEQRSLDLGTDSSAPEQSPPKGSVVSFDAGKRLNKNHGDRTAEKLLLEKAAKLRW